MNRRIVILLMAGAVLVVIMLAMSPMAPGFAAEGGIIGKACPNAEDVEGAKAGGAKAEAECKDGVIT